MLESFPPLLSRKRGGGKENRELTKMPPNNTMPGRPMFSVKFPFDECGNIFFDGELFQSLQESMTCSNTKLEVLFQTAKALILSKVAIMTSN